MGAFKAKIKIFDTVRNQWITKKDTTSFFPNNWDQGRIESEIISAYRNTIVNDGLKWIGKSKSGLKIEGYNRNGELTGYPVW